MHLSRPTFSLLLLATLAVGCARRNPAIPEARSVAVAPPAAPAPAVAPTAARDMTDILTEELNLTADQRQKVRAILSGVAEQANAAQKQFGTNRPALLAEQKRIITTSDKELQQVLTPTQYQQLKAKQRQLQAQRQTRQAN
jgi:Spy/CpxP family protein refolding chaperone